MIPVTWSAIVGLMLVASVAQAPAPQPSPGPKVRSVKDGVYTAAQAQRGEAVYHEFCSSCHGNNLRGKADEEVPALTGGRLKNGWDGRPLSDLFKKIIRNMPQDDPGHLNPQQTVDVVSFILNFNQLPAGETELPPDVKALSEILIEVPRAEKKELQSGHSSSFSLRAR